MFCSLLLILLFAAKQNYKKKEQTTKFNVVVVLQHFKSKMKNFNIDTTFFLFFFPTQTKSFLLLFLCFNIFCSFKQFFLVRFVCSVLYCCYYHVCSWLTKQKNQFGFKPKMRKHVGNMLL